MVGLGICKALREAKSSCQITDNYRGLDGSWIDSNSQLAILNGLG